MFWVVLAALVGAMAACFAVLVAIATAKPPEQPTPNVHIAAPEQAPEKTTAIPINQIVSGGGY